MKQRSREGLLKIISKRREKTGIGTFLSCMQI